MRALTQCWFTRSHTPEGRRWHKDEDGSWTGHCRHCGRHIVTWDRKRWFPADGFNVTRLIEAAGGRYLILHDINDDFIIARHSVGHFDDPAALEAFKQELREKHGIGQPGSSVELVDTGGSARHAPPPGMVKRRSGIGGLSTQY